MAREGAGQVKRQIVDWLKGHHDANGPDAWVTVTGTQVQVCRGLVKDGVCEMRGTYGRWKVRLKPKWKAAPSESASETPKGEIDG